MRTRLLVLSLSILAACASAPPTSRTATADEEGLICTKATPTGSFLPEERCTTAAERAAASRQNSVIIDARNERDSRIR